MEVITKHLCPYCERVYLALKLRKIPLDTVHIQQIDSGIFPENFIPLNPNKTFPTLKITSDLGFAESMVIVEYFDSIDATGQKLYGDSPEDIAKTKFNIENIENKIAAPMRKCNFTFGSKVEERKAFSKVTDAFFALGHLLDQKKSRYLGGEELNAEDVHLAPFIMRYLAVKTYKSDMPLPDLGSRSEKYFHDISHHSLVRKCIPHIEELALHVKKYNAAKGLNVDKIKESSRQIVVDAGKRLIDLNTLYKNNPWQLDKNDRGNFIYSKFCFKDSETALKAVHLLNELQEASDHHSSFVLENFSTLKVELCTHQPKYGVTEMDFAFAEVLTAKLLSL